MPAYIYISYPRKEGARFDVQYYITEHISIVEKHWGPFGMKSWTIVQFEEGDPSGLLVQAITEWDSIESFNKAIEAAVPEVVQDRKNFTDLTPVRYYANVLKSGSVNFQGTLDPI